MEEPNHTLTLSNLIAKVISGYSKLHPEADENDVMSALACLLCDFANQMDVPRSRFEENLMQTFDHSILCNHNTKND